MGLVKTRRLAAMRKQQRARRRDGEKAVRGVLSFWYTFPALPMVDEALIMTFFG